jgi:hypothetical protein
VKYVASEFIVSKIEIASFLRVGYHHQSSEHWLHRQPILWNSSSASSASCRSITTNISNNIQNFETILLCGNFDIAADDFHGYRNIWSRANVQTLHQSQ